MSMELYEANRILRAVKTALAADGFKLPSSAETDGLLLLLGKLDADKYLQPKIKHARTQTPGSAGYERAAKLLCFFRALEAMQSELSDPVTSMSVMLLHKTLCGDLDECAGKPRTKECFTDGNAHTDPKYINGSLKSIITKMNEIASAPETSKDNFAGYLSHYMRELIILHPFESGSELTVRIFLMMFCKLKGFSLHLYRTTAATIREAESAVVAFDDVAPLYTLLSDCLSYDHKTADSPRSERPRTRRELDRDLRRPARSNERITSGKGKQKPTSTLSDDEVLKRAIRLQQKISKLNDQLTELMNSKKTEE